MPQTGSFSVLSIFLGLYPGLIHLDNKVEDSWRQAFFPVFDLPFSHFVEFSLSSASLRPGRFTSWGEKLELSQLAATGDIVPTCKDGSCTAHLCGSSRAVHTFLQATRSWENPIVFTVKSLETTCYRRRGHIFPCRSDGEVADQIIMRRKWFVQKWKASGWSGLEHTKKCPTLVNYLLKRSTGSHMPSLVSK